jgi:hemoglobin
MIEPVWLPIALVAVRISNLNQCSFFPSLSMAFILPLFGVEEQIEPINGATKSMTNPDAVVYELIGHDGFDRLTAAFYRRVAHDDILRPMYPSQDMQGAWERLRDFLIFRFGGPAVYIQRRGHPRLRARHGPFAVDERARDRWVMLMDQALEEAKLPAEAAEILRDFFHKTATFLINRGDEQGGAGFAGNERFPVRE